MRVGKYADINLAWLEEEQYLHARCEEVRILYVALTRAREKILVVGNEKIEDKTIASMFMRARRYPYWDKRDPLLGEEDGLRVRYEESVNPDHFIYRQKADSQDLKKELTLQSQQENIQRRREAYQRLLNEVSLQAPSLMAEQAGAQDQQAMALGSVIHGALARVWSVPQEGVEKALTFAAMALQRADLLPQAREILIPYFSSALFQQLRLMKTLAVEMPFAEKQEQVMVRGVIDLLLEDQDATVWVIDYKTDHVDSASLPQAAQKYMTQMAVYKQAAQLLYPSKKIRSAVIFVRESEMLEL